LATVVRAFVVDTAEHDAGRREPSDG
jgi:hypothetical protein